MERLNTIVGQIAPSPVAGTENPLQIHFTPGERKRFYVDWSSVRFGDKDEWGNSIKGYNQKEEGILTFHVDKVDNLGRGYLRYTFDTTNIDSSGQLEVSPFGEIEIVQGETTPLSLYILKRLLHKRPDSIAKAHAGWGVLKPKCCDTDRFFAPREVLRSDGKFYIYNSGEGSTQLTESGWVKNSTERRSATYPVEYLDHAGRKCRTDATHAHSLQIKKLHVGAAQEMTLSFAQGEKRIYTVINTTRTQEKNLIPVMSGLKTVKRKESTQNTVSKTIFEIVLLVKKVFADGKAFFTFTQRDRSGETPNVTGQFVADEQGRISDFTSTDGEKALPIMRRILMQRPASEMQKVKGWPSGFRSIRYFQNPMGVVGYKLNGPNLLRSQNSVRIQTTGSCSGRFNLASDKWVDTHEETMEKKVVESSAFTQKVSKTTDVQTKLSIKQESRL